MTLNGLWGVDASNVWLVGNSGLILKWNGAGLTAQSSGSLTTQVGVWGSDANDCPACYCVAKATTTQGAA